MTDRYGYNDDNRNNELYREYEEWHNHNQGALRSSSGAGAYSRQSRSDAPRNSQEVPASSRGSQDRGGHAQTSRSQRRDDGYATRSASARSGERRSADAYGTRSNGRSSAQQDARSDARRSTANRSSRTGSYQPIDGNRTRSAERGATSQQVAQGGSRNAAAGYASRSTSSRNSSGLDSRSSRRASEQSRTSGAQAGQDGAARSSARTTADRYSRSSYGSGTRNSSSTSNYAANSGRYSTRTRRGSRADDATPAGRNANAAYERTGRSQGGDATATAKRPSNKKRNLTIAAVVAVALVLVGAISAYAYVNSISSNLHEGVDQDLRNALVKTDMANEPFYMLLLGTDKVWWREGTEEGGIYRSDTMILARVDAPQGTISLVSIPRDTLVDLGEYGWQKINAAYGLGGPSLAVEAVSKLTDVKISHYAEVDIDGLSAVVDAIGGIEVEVPIEIDDEDAGGYVAAGWQTLNGEQALILCRSRNAYIETSGAPDLMRAANQRMVLSAIAHKVLGSDVATIANTVNSVSGYVTTDLELNDIIGLAQAMQGINTDDAMYTASLPCHSAYVVAGLGYPDMYSSTPSDTLDPTIPDGWYGIIDKSDWDKMKQRMDQGLPPTEGYEIDEATGTVLATAGADAQDIGVKNCWITVMNGTDRSGLATRASGLLSAAGFNNVSVGNATEGYDYPETLVIYDNDGQAREAEQIVSALGQGRAMQNDGNWIVSNDFLIVIGDDWQGSGSSDTGAGSSN